MTLIAFWVFSGIAIGSAFLCITRRSPVASGTARPSTRVGFAAARLRTSTLPLLRRTRAIFRRAEFGFFGVMVLTCKHTPRFCAHLSRTGALLNLRGIRRCLRTNWLIVGIGTLDILGYGQSAAENPSLCRFGLAMSMGVLKPALGPTPTTR